uniref:Nectin cell adhesion molecule 4a n=1 Tax=Myripristis murdjan TaxID=586833 RepID=A0A667Y7D7_9TELE
MQALADRETVLPCRYKAQAGDTVVQVTWYKKSSDGSKEQIIAAHYTDGQTSSSWSGRVRFRESDPILDSSMVIMSTKLSDGGKYICHISTFPEGNFDLELSLIVSSDPISELIPVTLVEGQSYHLAATCRAMAHPPPRLSWDTDLSGHSTNRTSDNGAVSSLYSLHPLRSMNGKKLDCLVWHPTLRQPRRLRNTLVVHFPPDVKVSGFNGDWYQGLESAALRCVGGGNPTSENFTWTRKGKALPEGVIPHPNGTLIFGRALHVSDSGTYQCVAKNAAGSGEAEVTINVAEKQEQTLPENLLMIIVGAVAGGLLITMLVIVICVTCHHKRTSKKLEQELTEKKYADTGSSSSAPRLMHPSFLFSPQTEENIPLRVEGTLRTSLSSLGQARCRDSRSTISGGRGGGGGGSGLDYLGRPVLHNSSRRGRDRPLDRDEENRLRVESYVRNSSISLVSVYGCVRLHPPLIPSPFPVIHSTELLRQLNGNAIMPPDGGSLPGDITRNQQNSPLSCSYPPVTDDEDEEDEGLGGLMSPVNQERPDDQDSETNSSQVSEAHSTRFQQTNGTLRPKPRQNPMAISPHASLIHKAQIV